MNEEEFIGTFAGIEFMRAKKFYDALTPEQKKYIRFDKDDFLWDDIKEGKEWYKRNTSRRVMPYENL